MLLLAADFSDHELGTFYTVAEVEPAQVVLASGRVVRFACGTGVIVGPKQVLTNHHISEVVGEHTVVVHGGEVVRLTRVGVDREHDIALYEVVGDPLPHLTLREEPLTIGEAVAVVGFPGSEEVKTSFGTVLADGLVIDGIESVEYSAQTWWGSSGSAVIDAEGRLVAMHWGWDAEGESNGRLLGVPATHLSALLDAQPG